MRKEGEREGRRGMKEKEIGRREGHREKKTETESIIYLTNTQTPKKTHTNHTTL